MFPGMLLPTGGVLVLMWVLLGTSSWGSYVLYDYCPITQSYHNSGDNFSHVNFSVWVFLNYLGTVNLSSCQTLSGKGEIANTLGFGGHAVSVTATQLHAAVVWRQSQITDTWMSITVFQENIFTKSSGSTDLQSYFVELWTQFFSFMRNFYFRFFF
jgi:hypothetical protein